jgi:hypothetical protein
MGKVFVHRRYSSNKLAKPLTLDEQAAARLAEERERQRAAEEQRQQHRAARAMATAKYRAELRELMQEIRALPKKMHAEVTCLEPELVQAWSGVRNAAKKLRNPATGKLFTGEQLTELKIARRFLNSFIDGKPETCFGCGFDITSKTLSENRVPYEVVVISTIDRRMFARGLCLDCMELDEKGKASLLARALNAMDEDNPEGKS